MKKKRYSEEQIAYAQRQAEAGTPVKELIRNKWSGRGDSNSRPLEPHSSALTRLRYAPTV